LNLIYCISKYILNHAVLEQLQRIIAPQSAQRPRAGLLRARPRTTTPTRFGHHEGSSDRRLFVECPFRNRQEITPWPRKGAVFLMIPHKVPWAWSISMKRCFHTLLTVF